MDDDTDKADPLATRAMPIAAVPAPVAPVSFSACDSDSASGSGHLEVRCPNCDATTEVAADTTLTDLTCSACGSHFSLVDHSKATRIAPSLAKMGRFELIERLGMGGFGSVWKARDKELDRTVAIKIPRAAGMTSEEQEKFFREARAVAQLRHPGIVSVHEVGRDGDSIYIVSDFVRGVTLGDWLTAQQLTSREVAELCAKIADALEHAHEQGVVHRDLKPANIMIDGDGQPHLMDFGLARRDIGEVTVTVDGQILGTPAYMSPEQAQGEAHSADRRSDVYSLGVILFQLLTGELPFRGNAQMLMHQVIHDEPPSPRKLNANVSKDLETVTLKCLEKDPGRRYQTASELGGELRRFLSGEPIRARPIGRAERAIRWVRRNKAVFTLATAVALVLFAGAIVSTYFAIDARQQATAAFANETHALAAKRQAEAAENAAQSSNRELEWQQYLTSMQLAKLELEMGNGARAEEILRAEMSRAKNSERAQFEWYYLWNCCHEAVATFHNPSSGAVTATAFSPDGAFIASGGYSSAITVRATADGRVVATLPLAAGEVRCLEYSPDGTMIVVACDQALLLWKAKPAAKLLWRIDSQDATNPFQRAIFCLGNELVLATSRRLGTIDIRSFETGGVLFTAPVDLFASQATPAIAFESKTGRLATASNDGEVVMWDWKTGQKATLGFCGAKPNTIACSPMGDRVAVGGLGGVITCWGLSDARADRFDANNTVFSLAFNKEGTLLVAGGRSLSLTLCDLLEGTQRKQITDHVKAIRCVAFSPTHNGPLASGSDDSTVKLWDVSSGHYQVRALNATGVFAVSYISSGQEIASAHLDGDVNVYSHSLAGIARSYRGVWDRSRNQQLTLLDERIATFAIAAFCSHDALMATSAGKDEIDVWNIRANVDAQKKTSYRVARGNVRSLRWSANGELLAAGTDCGDIYAWFKHSKWDRVQLRNGDANAGSVETLAISRDGRVLAGGEINGRISVINLDSGVETNSIDAPTLLRTIALAPDGSQLASGSGAYGDDGQPVQLWDTSTGRCLHSLHGHSSGVRCLGFSPDGKVIVSGGYDGTLRLWDALRGSERLTIRTPRGMVLSVEFSPDGESLVSGNSDGTTMLWKAPRAGGEQDHSSDY